MFKKVNKLKALKKDRFQNSYREEKKAKSVIDLYYNDKNVLQALMYCDMQRFLK